MYMQAIKLLKTLESTQQSPDKYFAIPLDCKARCVCRTRHIEASTYQVRALADVMLLQELGKVPLMKLLLTSRNSSCRPATELKV